MELTIKQAKENAKLVKELFEAFQKIVNPLLIDDEQKQILDDAKWSIVGGFDAEIANAEHLNSISDDIWLRRELAKSFKIAINHNTLITIQ